MSIVQELTKTTKAANRRILKEAAEVKAETRRRAIEARKQQKARVSDIVDGLLTTAEESAYKGWWGFYSTTYIPGTDEFTYRTEICDELRRRGLWAKYDMQTHLPTAAVKFQVSWAKNDLKDSLLGDVDVE